MQLWKGRFKKELSKTTNDFNSSISFDSRMYKEDIEGSIAHATMLGRCGIIKEEEANDIVKGLKGILADIENGTLHIDMEAEDIHTFIEGELTKRIGDNGKRLHTSRSRNDQVAVDIKLYLKKEVVNVKNLVVGLIKVIADKAEKYAFTELYDSTKTVAKQIAEKNKYQIVGQFKGSAANVISLDAYNVPQGSVVAVSYTHLTLPTIA